MSSPGFEPRPYGTQSALLTITVGQLGYTENRNKLADTFAKQGPNRPVPSTSELTYLELFWTVGSLVVRASNSRPEGLGRCHQIPSKYTRTPCDDEFCGPRSDYVRQVSRRTTTTIELFSRLKAQNKEKWLKSPFHKWYKGKRPDISLFLSCDRHSNTCLPQLSSWDLESLTFSEGNKMSLICPKRHLQQPSPQNIYTLDWEDIHDSSLDIGLHLSQRID
ncbi:RNase H domain-containing protein [Trichonephila clavipes]|nr:RNase H domain-containing protein [Trichonephila clavipes]